MLCPPRGLLRAPAQPGLGSAPRPHAAAPSGTVKGRRKEAPTPASNVVAGAFHRWRGEIPNRRHPLPSGMGTADSSAGSRTRACRRHWDRLVPLNKLSGFRKNNTDHGGGEEVTAFTTHSLPLRFSRSPTLPTPTGTPSHPRASNRQAGGPRSLRPVPPGTGCPSPPCSCHLSRPGSARKFPLPPQRQVSPARPWAGLG